MSGAATARRTSRRNTGSDLLARVLSALPAIAFAILIVALGGTAFTVGVTLLGLACLHELFRMYEAARPVKLAGFLGLIGLAVAADLGGVDQVLLALAAAFPLVFLVSLLMPERRDATVTEGWAITLLAIFWVGMAVAHAILLRELEHGGGLVVDVLIGTFIGDTGAYLGGRAFGSRRLAPRISPNKTWEGLAIGVLTAVVATWCAGLYQDWLSHGEALLLGLAVGLAAPVGDLFESKVKRDAGRKDAGSLFGPHGGALDRLDAAFFSVVAGYYVARALL
jgi:phosphatidate cytidylyltransferase